MKSVLQNAALFLTASLIALGGIELGLRIWGPDVLAIGNQFVFFQFDPVLGWDNLPNAQGRFSRTEFSYPVKINSDGMWDDEVKPKAPDEFRVAVLGDSFTWGIGAAYGERFTEVVEARDRNVNVLNFGVSGFSPIQYLFQLDRIFQFQPDFIVIALCLGNDLTDNVTYDPYNQPKPYVVPSPDGETFVVKGYPLLDAKDVGLPLIGATSNSRILGMIEYLYESRHRRKDQGRGVDQTLIYVPPEKLGPEDAADVRSIYKLNELLLAAIKGKIEAASGPGRFAVLLAPTKYELGRYLHRPGSDPNYVGDQVRASLQRLGIPVVDGTTAIAESDYWKADGHWRPSGHAKIGELLAAFLARVHDEPAAPSDARRVLPDN